MVKEVLTEEQAKEFRKQMKDTKCSFCDTELKDEPIRYYVPHEYGWTVKGLKEKAWLYITCPNKKCHYDWAIWKLGVTRE